MVELVIQAGLDSLKEYIVLHVLTCLVPAFLLAGAIVSFVSREAIIGHLGSAVNKLKSFPIAAGGSFFIAVCSCTVIPVASGLYYGGAGIGPAFILLWVAPAANVLALVYTGSILGSQLVIARLVGAIAVSFIIGMIMFLSFRKEEMQRVQTFQASTGSVITRKNGILLLLLVISLLAPNYAVQGGSYSAKVVVWMAATIITAIYVWKIKSWSEIKGWMRETWWFVRVIFPFLLGGVFIVGVIGAVLPEAWIQRFLGGEGLRQSFLATMIGATTYFATMTEAPFVDTLMELGMGKGPALALLLTGPGLSLPSWLAIGRVFGFKKALVYVPSIIVLGTLLGWVAGFIL
jgi:uncharacterized membrane protein YraQ (UPF0718 family)